LIGDLCPEVNSTIECDLVDQLVVTPLVDPGDNVRNGFIVVLEICGLDFKRCSIIHLCNADVVHFLSLLEYFHSRPPHSIIIAIQHGKIVAIDLVVLGHVRLSFVGSFGRLLPRL
jgi:hypothetical protein